MPDTDPYLAQRITDALHTRRAEAALHPAVAAAARTFLTQVRAAATTLTAATLTAAAFATAPTNPQPPPGFPTDTAWRRALDKHVRPAARRLYAAAHTRLSATRATAQATAAYLAGLGDRLGGFRRTVWARLRQAIADGTRQGETPTQLRERVTALLAPAHWDAQVMTMTRTEATRALAAGAFSGALAEQERTGQPWEKRWQCTRHNGAPDDRVRPAHVAADAQVRPLTDPFTVGGHPLQFPGDPQGPPDQVINCRCTASYRPAPTPALTASTPPREDPTMAPPPTATTAPRADTTTPGPVTVTPTGRWRGVLGFMDEWSADQRMLAAPDAGVRSRPLPLPLLVQPTLANGHDGASLGVGVIDRLWTEGNALMGEGRFDMDDPIGAQLARKVGLGFIRFVSLDVDDATAQQVLVRPDGTLAPDGDPRDRTLSVGDVYSGWRVMGATLLAHPAFPNAQIALADTDGHALTAAAFAELVGYNPDWGCVKSVGDAYEAADCTDPHAVPANPTGDGPFQPEGPVEDTLKAAGLPQDDPDDDTPTESAEDPEESPEEKPQGVLPVDPAAEVPKDVLADPEDAEQELDPDADPPAGCVAQDDAGAWVPSPCDAPGAHPANEAGNGPADQDHTHQLAVRQGTEGTGGFNSGHTVPEDCEPCQAVTNEAPCGITASVMSGCGMTVCTCDKVTGRICPCQHLNDPNSPALIAATGSTAGGPARVDFAAAVSTDAAATANPSPTSSARTAEPSFRPARDTATPSAATSASSSATEISATNAPVSAAAKTPPSSKASASRPTAREGHPSAASASTPHAGATRSASPSSSGNTSTPSSNSSKAGAPSAAQASPSLQAKGLPATPTSTTATNAVRSEAGSAPRATGASGLSETTLNSFGAQPTTWTNAETEFPSPTSTSPRYPALVAAGSNFRPPTEWFNWPNLNGPTPVTVTSEGRVYGHIAAWSIDGKPSCHIGFRDRCVPPPHSASDYFYFHQKPFQTSDGYVNVGLLSMDTGHAGVSLGASAAVSHYDNTGTMAAAVRAGEDSYGIWVSGAVLPGLADSQLARLSLAGFSGDWRQINGAMELVAVLAVNVPGFPLPQRATGSDNRPYALVAAGALQPPSSPEAEPIQPVAADPGEVADMVISRLDARDQHRTRTTRALNTLAAFRNDTTARRAARAQRMAEAFRARVQRVQPQKKTETPMPLAGLGPLPTPSNHDISLAKNWVDEQGGLPPYIKRISDHLKAKGMDTSRAIATAIAAAKKMAATGDLQWPGLQQANPGSQAEAKAAVAQWEAMKAAARAS